MIHYNKIKVSAKVKAKHEISDYLMLLFNKPSEHIEDFETLTFKEQEEVLKHISLFEDRKGDIKLETIIIDKDLRKSGVGSKAMQDIVDFADRNNKRVKLTPAIRDDYQGTTSQARLRKFYKKFGFIENKGRNKDYEISELMYRLPVK